MRPEFRDDKVEVGIFCMERIKNNTWIKDAQKLKASRIKRIIAYDDEIYTVFVHCSRVIKGLKQYVFVVKRRNPGNVEAKTKESGEFIIQNDEVVFLDEATNVTWCCLKNVGKMLLRWNDEIPYKFASRKALISSGIEGKIYIEYTKSGLFRFLLENGDEMHKSHVFDLQLEVV